MPKGAGSGARQTGQTGGRAEGMRRFRSWSVCHSRARGRGSSAAWHGQHRADCLSLHQRDGREDGMAKRKPFEIGSATVAPGTRARVDIPVSTLSNHTPVNLSVEVVHGKRAGPVMFVSAAIHGDEVIGVEIMRRLLRAAPLNSMAGTLLAVPIVNTFGFLNHSRYLPDRRDLNRVFPGLSEGSMASQLAHIFMEQVVARSNVGIDLHSAAIHRSNLPQIRLTPGNARLEDLGRAFGAPRSEERRVGKECVSTC